MSTHRRAWLIRAGVIVVAAAATLLGVASPALAADPVVTITELANGNLQAGQSTSLKFSVQNQEPPASPDASISISVKSTIDGVTLRRGSSNCGQQCSFIESFHQGETKNYTITVTNSGVPQGQERSGELQIKANNASQSAPITARGPEQAQMVPEVSGSIANLFDAKPVEGAVVYLQDSASPPHEWNVATGKDGKFKFTSTQQKPIIPGAIGIVVQKEGWQEFQKGYTANAGQPAVIPRIMMRPTASASAVPSSSAVAAPTSDVALGTEQPVSATPNEKEGGLSWILMAIGGILVLLGIGAIALLFLRKRDDDDDDGDDDRPAPRKGGPTRVPAARGGVRPPPGRRGPPERTTVMRGPGGPPGPGNDPTRAMRPPVSPGPRGADQTMIARSPLADAPTMMHGRLPAEHGDPYAPPGRPNGAPPISPGGPGAHPYGPAGGYGGAPAGYAGAPGYGPQPDPYAQPAPSYGEPYGDAYSGGYSQQPGYGQAGGYGYDQPAGYGQQNGQNPQDQRAPRPAHPQDPSDRRLDWID